jgi:hypothetical protein
MARFQIRCPGCRKPFPWDPAIELPERCPLKGCGYVAKKRDPEVDEDGVIVIAAPFIGSAKTKATDSCYRELETSSAARAELAAQVAGVPVSEMSHLKVTNLKDNTREGEIAAMPVVNDVTRQMDRMKASGMPVGFGDQQHARVGASTGYAGMKAMQTVQNSIPHLVRR